MGIQEIADTFYLSKAYLCRIFKRTVGIPFSDYLNKTKLYHATRLLVTTNKSISEIATVCGFHSSAYFCNVFKKEYGVTPVMYKRDHGER